MELSQLISQANSAFLDEDYDGALQSYNQAAQQYPADASVYVARSQVHLKLENFIEAAADANKAIQLDPKQWKAYLRKGIATFSLEEYETAKAAFEAGRKVDPSVTQFNTWIRKCDAELQDEMEQEDDIGNQHEGALTTEQQPAVVQQQPSEPTSNGTVPASGTTGTAHTNLTAPIAPCATPTSMLKYRHQWLQTRTVVEVNILAKKMTQERVHVDIQADKLSIAIDSPEGEEEYRLEEELYGPVDPDKSKVSILGTKVEVRLAKANGTQWPTLEKSEQRAAANYAANQPPPLPYAQRRPVNWDKLEAEIKEETKHEKLEGDQALFKLFRDIYGNADEATRRAMNKSFQESNGTCLSTNWKEVGAKPVECTPPTGMETKKFEI